ncbi:MAG: hypothetical protein DSO07_08490 [Thermoproteota archaeon]|uniref:Uncharacterized protein n=1 Tax=Candidatus Methanodesulfokora washburnensis TaxID=2478471 RepID=A0A429GEQ4_9CREN|nr:hypothetical protein D6D85_14265 [Candidatus Methanodesulfokores washburnensis]TDA40686.1 MAG: hypothetical protein DSO07_08490 [Candidatus Korarchaeota archaeon]
MKDVEIRWINKPIMNASALMSDDNCTSACAVVCNVAFFFVTLLACGTTGPGVIGCGLVMTVIGAVVCDNICTDVCYGPSEWEEYDPMQFD